jgi:diguanylate cyclase (GGDEF)-like protein/PAS domain S-box-containing protein
MHSVTASPPVQVSPSERALIAAPVGILETDPTGARIFVNDRWCELAGMTREAALGEGWLAAIHPADRDRVATEWTKAFEGRLDFSQEYRFQRTDGTVVWVAGVGKALDPDDRGGSVYVGVVTDISAAVATREELRTQGRFLDAVLDVAGSLVCVIDPSGRFLRFNKACELASGYTFEEIRDRPFYDFLIPTDEAEGVRAALAGLRVGDPPASNQNHWVTKTGGVRLMSWSNVSFFDDDGTLTHVVSTGTDITEERAAQVALAERARLFTDLIAFAQVANATLNTEDLLPRLLHAIAATLPSDLLGLVLIDPPTGNYVVRAVRGTFKAMAVGTVIPPGVGVLGRAIATRTMVFDHVERSQLPAAALVDLVDAESLYMVGVPLVHESAVLGALLVGRLKAADPAYSVLESEALSMIAAQTSLSLTNARLLKEVSELAIRDGLTGLYNRRYFEASLEEMLKRRARKRKDRVPIAAIMFDLDHFGAFNNDHGHQVGDGVLRQFAGLLNERFRSSDLVARYGGEEFVAILEGSTVEDARSAAEDVRQALEALSILGADGSRLNATVSAGCAGLDPLDPTRETLLRAADVGLFMAKRAGRNAVIAI